MNGLRQRGFSLLEILLALAIVSILAVIAIPPYLDYTVRARVSEGIALVDPIKARVTVYYQSTGTWPDSNATADLEAPAAYKSDNVDAISVAAGTAGVAITVSYRIPALGGNNTIVFTPDTATGWIQWSCKQGTMANRYRPATCRT